MCSTCSICLNELNSSSDIFCLPCSHSFHTECINKWLETQANSNSVCTCPECRHVVFPPPGPLSSVPPPPPRRVAFPPPPPRLVRQRLPFPPVPSITLSAKERRRIRQRRKRRIKRRIDRTLTFSLIEIFL